jgi:hypothetical protein
VVTHGKPYSIHFDKRPVAVLEKEGSPKIACGQRMPGAQSTPYVNQITCGACKQTSLYKYIIRIRDTGKVDR